MGAGPIHKSQSRCSGGGVIGLEQVGETGIGFLEFLNPHVRRIADDNIEPAFAVKHFGEINLEVEGFLAVGQFVDGGFNLPLELGLFGRIGLIEEARLEFFEAAEVAFVEQVFLHAEQRVAGDDFVEQVRQRLDLLHVLLVHDEREPEAELGDFHRAGINVHAVKAVLDGVALEVVGRAVVNVVEVRRQRGAGADNLAHHPHRERA